MNTDKKDIFQRVTDVIVKAIEDGAGSYRMPWRTSGGFANSPINAVSKRPYRGINILVLWARAQEKGYKSGTWATYKQWQELGAQVRKGEKSANVVFWKFFDRESETQDSSGENEPSPRKIPMARDYWVFNAEQVEGYTIAEEPKASLKDRIESAEGFFGNLGIEVQPGGNRAFYRVETDSIHMPAFEAFLEPLYFYSVLSHESTHWTAAAHRLNRDLSGRFGSESYAAEELVAELGAAFLCGTLGLPSDPREDHAPYIASWLNVLKNDKRAIFTAAAKAQEAVDWMINKSPSEQETTLAVSSSKQANVPALYLVP
jgi:antirestriction protein ArdC